MPSIASVLRDARRRAGLTQAELAERARTSQPAINRYERGSGLPTLPTLERLLRACGHELVIAGVPADSISGSRTSVRGQLGPLAAILRRRRARLLEAGRRRGARSIRVFGSVARGEETAESDIDLLIDLGPGRTLLDLVGFRREASEILDAEVDVATLDMLKERFRDQVLSEAAPL